MPPKQKRGRHLKPFRHLGPLVESGLIGLEEEARMSVRFVNARLKKEVSQAFDVLLEHASEVTKENGVTDPEAAAERVLDLAKRHAGVLLSTGVLDKVKMAEDPTDQPPAVPLVVDSRELAMALTSAINDVARTAHPDTIDITPEAAE